MLIEELVAEDTSVTGFPLQNDVVAPYLLRLATPAQKARSLPGFCSGEIISSGQLCSARSPQRMDQLVGFLREATATAFTTGRG